MQFPDNLKYSKDHEWIRVEGDEAYVGITEFAAGELGDIVFVDVDTEGESLDKDEVFGSVEAVKTVSDLFLPVSGEVLEFNEELRGRSRIGKRRSLRQRLDGENENCRSVGIGWINGRCCLRSNARIKRC